MPYRIILLGNLGIVDKLPQNIIWCKAYGIPDVQNKTCKC